MNRKALLFLIALLLATLGSGFFVEESKADTAGDLGSFVMPKSGYVTALYADAYDPWGAGGAISLKDGGTTITSSSLSQSDWKQWIDVEDVFVYAGHTYTLEITLNDETDAYSISASLSYAPYYLITVNSVYGNPTDSMYVREGESFDVSVTSPQSAGSGARYTCTGYQIDGGGLTEGTSYKFTNVQTTHTITFSWQLQYEVTYSATGLDSSAQGTIVTVDGSAKTYANLPFSKWVNNGASTSFTYGNTISSSTSGKQFRLSSSVSSPQTIYAPTTITDGYTIQYQLSITTAHSSGIGEGWYDAGTTAYAYLAANTVYDGDYTRYNFVSWTGVGSGSYTGSSTTATVTMNGPISQVANWQTQYYLNVVGTYAATTGSGWYNAGATASFNVTSPISGGAGVQTAFDSWSGVGSGSYSGSAQASSCTMNAPITETVNWVTQYYLTVSSLYGTTTGEGWYNAGAVVNAGLTSGTVSGGTGVRYNFNSWSVGGTNYAESNNITMSYPITATASWSTQYYLTVSSPYSTTSGEGWYNAGASAYAGVATNVVTDGDGTHTFQGWSNGASGTSITSNPITMSSAKTALAVWSTTGGGGGGPTNYTVILHGPYFEDGTAAADNTITCTLLYANNTVYSFTMNSSVGVVEDKTITSTSPFIQLTWNASNPEIANFTRIYRFITTESEDEINLYIVRSTQPSFVYTFSITDFYGMVNPYLETHISPDGVNSYVVERADLTEGGTVAFVMTQYQIYSLVFVCDQGTYTQSFTAQIQGTPGQYPVSLNVLAGNFPAVNSSSTLYCEANRLNATTVSVSYVDPNNATSWVYVRIYHIQGATEITDYVGNSTGSVQFILWQLGTSGVNYLVDVQSLSDGTLYAWDLTAATSFSDDNPFLGVLDFLGQHTDTLPEVQSGWPSNMTTGQIAQLIAAFIVMLFLCIGSFRSAGACCILSWLIFGILLFLGWFGVVTIYTIPMFALSGCVALVIAIDESKKESGGQY